MTDTIQPSLIIYNTNDGKANMALYAQDDDIWLNQNQLAELFANSVPNISIHISNMLKEKELLETSVIKSYLTLSLTVKFGKIITARTRHQK